jgi:hypothetical protein
MKRLTKGSIDVPLSAICKAECSGIERLSGKRPLRLKTAGDTPNNRYAKALAKSCAKYSAKKGHKAYGYTHNWRKLDSTSFGAISILASCDKSADIALAKSRGYATAVVVSEFPNGAKLFVKDGNKIIPCPSQIADINGRDYHCSECMLCAFDDKLRKADITVGLLAHGAKAEQLKTRLQAESL